MVFWWICPNLQGRSIVLLAHHLTQIQDAQYGDSRLNILMLELVDPRIPFNFSSQNITININNINPYIYYVMSDRNAHYVTGKAIK